MSITNLHLSVNLQVNPIIKPKDENRTVPNDGRRYVQILPDVDVMGAPRQFFVSGKPKYAFPAMVRKDWGIRYLYTEEQKNQYKGIPYMPLSKEWQKFIWDMLDWGTGYSLPKGRIEEFYTKTSNSGLFARATKGSLTELWISLMEKSVAYTDSWSPEVGGRDWMTSRNLENSDLEFLLHPTTLAMCHAIKSVGTEWEIEALDILSSPPKLSYVIANPHLYYWATQQDTIRLGNKQPFEYVVSDFPKCDQVIKVHNPNNPRIGTPMPLLAIGKSFRIKKSACRELKNGERVSAYLPIK